MTDPVDTDVRKHTPQCHGYATGFTDPAKCTCGAVPTGWTFTPEQMRTLANNTRLPWAEWRDQMRFMLFSAAEQIEARRGGPDD